MTLHFQGLTLKVFAPEPGSGRPGLRTVNNMDLPLVTGFGWEMDSAQVTPWKWTVGHKGDCALTEWREAVASRQEPT